MTEFGADVQIRLMGMARHNFAGYGLDALVSLFVDEQLNTGVTARDDEGRTA